MAVFGISADFSRKRMHLLLDRLLLRLAGTPLGRLGAPLARLCSTLGFVLHGTRFVLTIGEEGTTLVHLRRTQVIDALFVAPDAEDGPETLREYISTDPRSEVLVVADVLEQMFREDTMPKVSPLDRNKIVNRRLSLAYPNEVLKGAMRLPRKRGEPQNVMFTALPTTTTIETWISFVESLPNPILGIALLPLEISDLAKAVGPSTAGDSRRVWRAIITHQAGSGVRQVFEREGNFVVTRLTQKSSRDMTAEAEAMLIERELRSSISYIKRLGYSDADRLDLVLLVDPEVGAAVQERDLPATSVTVLTPYQAGLTAGFGEVGREDSPYSDVLLALWLSAKSKLRIMLPSPEIARRLRMAAITRWCTGATVAITLATLVFTGSFLNDYLDAGDTAASLASGRDDYKEELKKLQGQLDASPIPIATLTAVANADSSMGAAQVNPVNLLVSLQHAMDPTIRLDYFDLETPDLNGSPAPPRPGQPRVIYELHVVVRFIGPNASDADAMLRKAKDFQAKLATAFDGLSVDAIHLPAPLSSETLEVSVGGANGNGQAAAEAPTAEFLIRKTG